MTYTDLPAVNPNGALDAPATYAITRFTDEVNRLYGVLNNRLHKHKYIAGEQYTIADIGQTSTKVLYYGTDTYMQYLLGAGILSEAEWKSIDSGLLPSQYDEICRIAGPESPRCVNKIFSRKLCFPAVTIESTDTGSRVEITSRSYFES